MKRSTFFCWSRKVFKRHLDPPTDEEVFFLSGMLSADRCLAVELGSSSGKKLLRVKTDLYCTGSTGWSFSLELDSTNSEVSLCG